MSMRPRQSASRRPLQPQRVAAVAATDARVRAPSLTGAAAGAPRHRRLGSCARRGRTGKARRLRTACSAVVKRDGRAWPGR
eukprot:scaffold2560_cov397-Prasinococcus_capsulatus_cf.AAC.12